MSSRPVKSTDGIPVGTNVARSLVGVPTAWHLGRTRLFSSVVVVAVAPVATAAPTPNLPPVTTTTHVVVVVAWG